MYDQSNYVEAWINGLYIHNAKKKKNLKLFWRYPDEDKGMMKYISLTFLTFPSFTKLEGFKMPLRFSVSANSNVR
jgi:hypothetical protein